MQTLAIIKPDAVAGKKAGKVIAHLEDAGFTLSAARVAKLSVAEAESFYAMHSERPFFRSLIEFMTSGPCMLLLLEHENAVEWLRTVVGATDPAEADEGTVRRLYGGSKERNAIHASDSTESALREIAFLFSASGMAGESR